MDNSSVFQSELALTLDVIFHIIEDDLYELYIRHLFNSARKDVVIYSSNHDELGFSHVKHRKFTNYIEG